MDNDGWQALINVAMRAGYSVEQDDGDGWWWVITPKRPRRPSETLGVYKDHRAAWRGAALLSHLETSGD
jgi:hypothetical protein